MGVYLTYDNSKLRDGLGAQLLRILGIYSLAKFTKTNYVHSPIIETIEEFSHNISNQEDLEFLTNSVNSFFWLPSDPPPDKFDKVIEIHNLGLKSLLHLKFKYGLSRQKVLVRILLPFCCTDRFPWLYKIAVSFVRQSQNSTFMRHRKESLVVHLRLGYGQRTKVADHVRPRFLPVEYYVELLKSIRNNMDELELPREITVHTDLAKKAQVWKPTPKSLQVIKDFGEDVVDGTILVQPTDLSLVFTGFSDVSFDFRHCEDFFKTFLDMACAHNLVMSRSALSYLAALFNEGRIIYPSSHGHAKLKQWTSSEEYGLRNNYKLIPG
jgi:hypothetical protein